MNNKHELPISEETRKFLESKHLLFINGEWIESSSGEIIPVVDPATEEKIAEVQSGTKDDIDLAVRSARNALEAEWSKIPSHDRAQILHRLSDEIEANFSVLSELEVLDNGMPMQLAQYSIASHGVTLLRYFASWAPKIHGKTIPVSPGGVMNGDSLTYTKREPIGVVGAIVPWNSPLIFAILKLAPALAAGCTVVLKPAELTPLTALYFAHLIEKSGIPKGVVNIVTGFGETAGDALAKHEDVDKITFTGSLKLERRSSHLLSVI